MGVVQAAGACGRCTCRLRAPWEHPRRACSNRKIASAITRAAAAESTPPPALPAAATAQTGSPAAAQAAEDSDEWLALPDAQHIVVEQNFKPDVVQKLRAHFDQRLGNPLHASADRFCLDWWHIENQYTLLRTPADVFFPQPLYETLVDSLVEYGERVLGCRGISPLWLSVYVDGCQQEWHTDAPHGPFAFVLSLTNWEERRFSGGETMLLQLHVLDFWRTFDSSKGTETPQLVTHVAPQFGQLTVFDGRIPHGVRQVEGTRNLLEGRVVLHGWFTQPSPFFAGALSEEEATPALNKCLDELYGVLPDLPPVVGIVTLRLQVAGDSGCVADLQWLANTLVARPQGGQEEPWEATEATLACIANHLLAARFPPSGNAQPTFITLPFVFE